jgi:hypothetical protein
MPTTFTGTHPGIKTSGVLRLILSLNDCGANTVVSIVISSPKSSQPISFFTVSVFFWIVVGCGDVDH